MAGDWIKIEHATPDKPEVVQIAGLLNIDHDAAFGKCVRFWIWIDQQSEDGEGIAVTHAFIDRMTYCPGFADALVKIGWLIEDGMSLSLPNFDRHNGQTAKKRASGRKRTQQCRNAAALQKRYQLPRPVRAAIKHRDNSTCVYCGRKEGETTPQETRRDGQMAIDHVIPASKGGDDTPDNLVCACMACNGVKLDRTPDEAGMRWPVDVTGKRYGSVTKPLPEKRREEKIIYAANELPPDPKADPKDGYPPEFETWWSSYPKNANGRKRGKRTCLGIWKRIPANDRTDLAKATKHYASEQTEFIRDPERFLKQDFWRDYVEPPDRTGTTKGMPTLDLAANARARKAAKAQGGKK